MATVKILVIDDEKGFLGALCRSIEAQGIKTVYSESASEGLLLAKESKPDLILTDAELSDMDGFSLCRVIKENPATREIPVIIMSGKDIEEEDILKGYEKGADDYILKPFSVKVLLAKIHAVITRYRKDKTRENSIKKIGIAIDPECRTVKSGNSVINLTRKEFDLLNLLISKTGKVLTANYILETVWGYDPALYNDPHTIEVHVSSLRKKLGTEIGKKIKNVIGVGYKLEI